MSKPEFEDPKLKELETLKNRDKKQNADVEELVVNWQTKIFSKVGKISYKKLLSPDYLKKKFLFKREYKRYTNPKFEPKSILEEHYVSECLKLK